MEIKRRISLANELTEIRDALEAVRVLCDELRNDGMATEEDALEVPRWCAAVTNLAAERLRLLSAVVNGTIDPAWVFSNYNKAIDPGHADDAEDIILTAWSVERRRAEAIAELRRTAKSNPRGPRSKR